MSHGSHVETTDLIKLLLSNSERKDFFLDLLIKRMDNAFKSDHVPFSSLMGFSSKPVDLGFVRKISYPTLMDEINSCTDTAFKGIFTVAIILENFALLQICRKDCWTLLKKMYKLAKGIVKLRDFPILNNLQREKKWETDPAISTIAEASFCCFIQKKGRISVLPVLSSCSYKKNITNNIKLVNEAYIDLGTQMIVYILRFKQRRLDGIDGVADEGRPEQQRKQEAGEPEVEASEGKKRKVKVIINDLFIQQKEEHRKALVFVGDSRQLYSDIANKEYDRVEAELVFRGWNVYKKAFIGDQEFNPDIEQLVSDIDNHCSSDGNKFFLYMDNILRAHDLRKIFDGNVKLPKKVRLLVTSPNTGVQSALEGCKFSVEEYVIEQPLILEMKGTYKNQCTRADDLVETGFDLALEIAFLNLPAPSQHAFLDICCFFEGWDWDEVSLVLGEAELEMLHENGWVKSNYANQITVPACLRNYGQGKGTGVTRIEQDTPEQIKAVRVVDNESIESETLNDESEHLRILSMGGSTTVKGKCSKPFNQLKFLKVGDFRRNFPFGTTLEMSNIRYFSSDEDVEFALSQDLEDEFNSEDIKEEYKETERQKEIGSILKGFGGLRLLCVDAHVKNLEQIRYLEKLVSLRLSNCKLNIYQTEAFKPFRILRELSIRACNVIELPESLAWLHFLHKLDLQDCKYLQKLPASFGELASLVKLNLGCCSSLRRLPESFGELQSLEELILNNCSALMQLPQSFVRLATLKKAIFAYCYRMLKLPEKFEVLHSLEELDLSYCKNLEFLPTNFELLSSLKLLNLQGCSKLEKLPTNFPESLFKPKSVAIKISECSRVRAVPGNFCKGNNIEDLSLAYWTELEMLPAQINEFRMLRKVNLSACQKLTKLPENFSELGNLELLNLSFCKQLRNLCGGFDKLKALKYLNVSKCSVLRTKWMKTIITMRSLRLVDIQESPWLTFYWLTQKSSSRFFCQLTVITGEIQDDFRRVTLNKAASDFFQDKVTLIDQLGKTFLLSQNITEGTSLALIFDYNISHWDWEMLENNVDELLTNLSSMLVIYVGRSFTSLPTKLANKIWAYTPTNSTSKTLSFFDRALSVTAAIHFWNFNTHIIKTVVEKDNATLKFRDWESISGELVGRNFKIEKYNTVKEMIDVPSDDDSPEDHGPGHTMFELPGQEKIIEENQMALLLVSKMDISEAQLSAFKEMYYQMQGIKRKFELVWFWVPVVNAERPVSTETYEKIIKMMPWVKILDERLMHQSTAIKILKERMGFREMPMLLRLDNWGNISATDILPKVAMLGSKAWLFLIDDKLTDEDTDKMREMEDVSKFNLSYVFENVLNIKMKEMEVESKFSLSYIFANAMSVQMNPSNTKSIGLCAGDDGSISELHQKSREVMLDQNMFTTLLCVGSRHLYVPDIEKAKRKSEKTENHIQKFWNHIIYLMYLVAYQKSASDTLSSQIESLQRLLLCILSFDCLSKRKHKMSTNSSSYIIFTENGNGLSEALYVEGGKPKREDFKEASWLATHPSSHLVEQFSDIGYCSMCFDGEPAYQCDNCQCFSICEKCYALEYTRERKHETEEQLAAGCVYKCSLTSSP